MRAGGPWQVPRCFAGGTVAILASGPSMSAAVADAVHAASVPAVAINTTFRLAPWAWMLYAADYEWWQHPEHADAKAFAGHKVTIYTGSGQPPAGLSWLTSSGSTGFDPDPRNVRTGSNSGYQALHIAAQTGACRVLLCGYDMHGSHWHGEHPRGLKVNTVDGFEKFRARFADLVKPMKQLGVDVINCTPGSRLECFRRSTLEAELEKAKC
jgi:hypothetical protein